MDFEEFREKLKEDLAERLFDRTGEDYDITSSSVNKLQNAGYDYWAVQHLVNGLANGYDAVAKDVIAGKYGNGQARVAALQNKGYDAKMVQDIVNGMLMN